MKIRIGDYGADRAEVYLNGRMVRAIEADDQQGYVVVLNRDGTTERFYGRVEIAGLEGIRKGIIYR